MKVVLLLSLVSMIFSAAIDIDLDRMWEDYKIIFQKKYKCELEHMQRKKNWELNFKKIMTHNYEADLGKHSFRLRMNHLADMTDHEVIAKLNGHSAQKNSNLKAERIFKASPGFISPKEVDWRKEDFVTRVKNQGDCRSCWAFSATGSLEGQHRNKIGRLVSLSEQNLLDCVESEGTNGCKGGRVESAFTYIKENGGIDTEESYPYKAQVNECEFNKTSIGATVTGFVNIPSGNELALQEAVTAIGPISAVIVPCATNFYLYSDGVYDEENCSSTAPTIIHAVLVVGYGIENDKAYWLVKNSWGERWGEKGYIKMSRNNENQCGIATNASYPLV